MYIIREQVAKDAQYDLPGSIDHQFKNGGAPFCDLAFLASRHEIRKSRRKIAKRDSIGSIERFQSTVL